MGREKEECHPVRPLLAGRIVFWKGREGVVVLYSIVLCSHVRLGIITSFVVIFVHTCEFHVNPLSWM